MSFSECDFDRLNERLAGLVADGSICDEKHGVIHLILSNKFYCEQYEINEAITDGPNDCGIDAVYIDRRGDDPVVHLFQSKVHSSRRKARNPFPASSLEKIHRFLQIVKERKSDLSKVVNEKLEQKVLEIRSEIDRNFPIFKLWLVSNGSPCLSHEIFPLKNALESRESIEIEEFHLLEVVEFCLNAHSTRTNHTFYAKEVGVIEAGTSELRSVVGYLSAKQLYDLIKDVRDERKVDYSVFNLNVRGFLGLDNSVNKDIFRSASASSNIHFSSLNNGITVVGSTLRVNRTASDRPRIGVKKMSIVNGAQTCHAIFEAMKDYYPDFSTFEHLSVLFRVFETDDPDLISSIAISTNNQNRIGPRDLRANDVHQIRLEEKLAALGVRYRRKRSFTAEPSSDMPTIDALKAGQILLAYVHHDPARAKRDSDSIFTDFYQKIFAEVDPSILVKGLDWFNLIEERRQYIEDEVRIRGSLRAENTFVTYGVFHILMMCSVINPNAEGDDRHTVIDEAITAISKKLEEEGYPAYYTYFRDTSRARELLESAAQPRLI
ncbi:AIPR family protein [Aliiroseovarius crassostreae]|uniref:AIPR family protein n=1 Tax=Aliiroseovarius crassostreae TaxID=154981 RepID=UPI0021FEBAF8|nr:AIPR family protein [Aliiroseovarius crassostreae]UWP89942.1 AIPR family protein [Aliiroseovarius crassostreae]